MLKKRSEKLGFNTAGKLLSKHFNVKSALRIFAGLTVVLAIFWTTLFGFSGAFRVFSQNNSYAAENNDNLDTIIGDNNTPKNQNALETVSNDSETAVKSANPSDEIAPYNSLLYDLIGVDGSQPLEIILLITILSVAPSLLLMMTCYARIIIVFGFLRNAMQTQSTPPNQVLAGLSLFLTLFIMWPVFSEINTVAYKPYANGEISMGQALTKAGEPMKTFMLKQTTNKNMAFFLNLKETVIYDEPVDAETLEEEELIPIDFADKEISLENYQEKLGFECVIPAFMLSELTRAFQMGFLLFVPFLVIDLVVASTLMSMGMMMLPPAMISLPFKIMLFVLVDGWQLLIGAIIATYK